MMGNDNDYAILSMKGNTSNRSKDDRRGSLELVLKLTGSQRLCVICVTCSQGSVDLLQFASASKPGSWISNGSTSEFRWAFTPPKLEWTTLGNKAQCRSNLSDSRNVWEPKQVRGIWDGNSLQLIFTALSTVTTLRQTFSEQTMTNCQQIFLSKWPKRQKSLALDPGFCLLIN